MSFWGFLRSGLLLATLLMTISGPPCHAQYKRIANPNLRTIAINPKRAEVVDLEDMAKSIQVLKLENRDESFFGYAAKVLMTSGRVFVFTGGRDPKIFTFSRNGKFIFKVEATGSGPQELDRITNFAVDGDQLLVYGDMARKVQRFSRDGALLSQHKLDFYAKNFIKSGDEWVFSLQSGSMEGESSEMLILTDSSFKTKWRFFPIKETALSHVVTYTKFLKLDERVQFALFQNDTIFSINARGVSPVFFIDFGKYSINKALRDRSYGRDIFERLQKSNHAESRVTHTLAGDMLGFTYVKYNRNTRKDNRVRHVYYSEKSNKVIWHYYKLTLDRFGAMVPSAFYQYDDQLITPVSFLQLFENNEDELNNSRRAGTSEGYGLMSLDEAMAVMKEEDNPYLFIYKVRSAN